MLTFILGFILGAFFGLFVTCCLVLSGRNDDDTK